MTYNAPTGENSRKTRPVAEVGLIGDLGKNMKLGLALRALIMSVGYVVGMACKLKICF